MFTLKKLVLFPLAVGFEVLGNLAYDLRNLMDYPELETNVFKRTWWAFFDKVRIGFWKLSDTFDDIK